MKRNNDTLLLIATPVICLLLGVVLMINQTGRPLEARPAQLDRLSITELIAGPAAAAESWDAPGQAEPERTEPVEQFDILLLAEEQESALLTVTEETLGEMKLSWKLSDCLREEDLAQAGTVLLCSSSLADLEGEGAVTLMSWVEAGGRLVLMTTPDVDGWLPIVSHKLGILDYGQEYAAYYALRTAEGEWPVFGDVVLDEELEDYMLAVHLESDCDVLMSSVGERDNPLLWARDLGEGRVAVCNHTLVNGKDARGYVLMALRAVEDALVYPIVNAGLVFIDDFPAPQPEGYDDFLREQYGYSIQGFFRNYWWPNMKALTESFGLRYTGVLVETYNRVMTAPFEPDTDDDSLIRYYASELLQAGGEIGLHGYNHQPLCLDGWEYADEDYVTWASREDMAGAVTELFRYGKSFLPEAEFTSYVPPSNYLSPEGQAVLLETVPTMSVISGLYLPETGVNALVQEFREEADGSISVPRVTSGFSMDAYGKTVAAAELSLHGVFSHFIHPDDVLDEERGALLGWERLYSDFIEALTEIRTAYPFLRWCTATEAGAAVQRYDRVELERSWDEEGETLTLRLDNFYDEVWLCLWFREAPASVDGAELFPVSDACCWLRADQDTVTLDWGDGL